MRQISGSGGGGGKGGGGSVGPNTLQSDTFAKWLCLVCEGPIQGFGPNPNNQPLGGVYFNDVLVLTNPLELNDEYLTWNYEIKDFEYRYGDPVQTVMPDFTDTEAVHTVGLQVYNTTPITASTSGPGIDSLRVTVGVGALIYTDPTSGNVSGTSVNIQIWIQPFGGEWLLAANSTIGGQVSGSYLCDYQFPLPDNTLQYNVKVMRITPDSTQPTLENTTFFAYFTEIQNVKQYYPNSVLAGFYINSEYFGSSMPQCGFLVNGLLIQVPSNYYSNLTVAGMTAANPGTVTIPNHGIPLGTSNFQMSFYGPSGWSTYLNGVTFDLCSVIDANTISLGIDATNAPAYPTGTTGSAVAYVGTWDGTFKTEFSNCPAWCMYDIYTNTRYGLGIEAAMVDKWGLYTIAQYCDGIVSNGYGGFERRYTMNCVIKQQDNAIKQLALMASCFQGSVYNSSSGVGFTMDRYQAPSEYKMIVSPANVIAGQFCYSGSAFSDRHTVCLVHWNNPDLLYKKDIEVVEDGPGIALYGWNQVEITAFGCTSRGQAHRKGAMLLDTEQHSTEIVTYRGGYEHVMTMPGDIIQVADPAYAGARFAGRIVSFVDTGTDYEVTLDAAVILAAGVSYLFGCIVSNPTDDGYITQGSSITTAAGTQTVIHVAYNSWTSLPAIGTVWAISDASGEGIAPRPFVVVDKKETGEITFEITAVLYDPTKYDRVEQNLPTLKPSNYTSLYSVMTVLPAPTNLQVVEASALDSGGILKQKTYLSWECAGITSTSSTSVTIGVGSQTFTISGGLALVSGQRMRAMDAASPETNWMEGTITSYNSATGALVVAIDTIVGSGTFASWSMAQQSAQVSYYHVWVKSVSKGTTTDLNTTPDPFMNIAQLLPDQYLFTVQAFNSSGKGSQNGYLDYAVTKAVVSTVALGTHVTSSTGAVLDDAQVITSQGTAAAIANQGALATLNEVNGTYIASGTIPAASASVPSMDGTAAAGASGEWADGAHVHPTDTSKIPYSGATGTVDLNAQELSNVGDVSLAVVALGTPALNGTASLSGQVNSVTIANACTLQFPAGTTGRREAKGIWITNGGAAAITWNPAPTWASGTPTFNASGLNIVYCESIDGWATVICWLTK